MQGPIRRSVLNDRILFKRLAIFVSTVIMSVSDFSGIAATPAFRWAASVAPGYYNRGTNTTPLAVDSTGNSCLFSQFTGTITNGTNVFASRGGHDILMTRYDRTGSLSWAKRLGGEKDETGFGITVDASGNYYLVGSSSGSTNADFGQITLTNTDDNYLFIVKFDPNGNTIWLNKAGGNVGPVPTAVTADGSGNCYVIGSLGQQTSRFGSIVLTNAIPNSGFIAKYDSNGSLVWVRIASPSFLSSLSVNRVTVDKGGSVYCLGEYSGTLSFDGFLLRGRTSFNWFWAQLDGSGNIASLKRIGASTSVPGQVNVTLALNAMDHVYFAGTFTAPAGSTNVDFGGLALTNHGLSDAFVAKCDMAGNALWVKTLAGKGLDTSAGIAVDGDDNCYVLGSFAVNAIDFGGATLASRGDYDVFVAKFDAVGTLVWAKQAGGIHYDSGLGISLDAAGNCYIAGVYSLLASFDSIQMTSARYWTLFLAKIVEPPALNLTRVGQQVLLYWPANKIDFALESSASLSTDVIWSPVTNPSAIVGDQRLVIEDSSVANTRFYRLKE